MAWPSYTQNDFNKLQEMIYDYNENLRLTKLRNEEEEAQRQRSKDLQRFKILLEKLFPAESVHIKKMLHLI